jgi:hypothetical protein
MNFKSLDFKYPSNHNFSIKSIKSGRQLFQTDKSLAKFIALKMNAFTLIYAKNCMIIILNIKQSAYRKNE